LGKRSSVVLVVLGVSTALSATSPAADIRTDDVGRSYEGVVCREAIPARLCRNLVDHLPRHLRSAIRHYNESYDAWAGGFGPNCHWMTLGYFFPEVARSNEPINLRKVPDYFERLGFRPVAGPHPGTVVVFTFEGRDVYRGIDLASGESVSVEGALYREPLHTAVVVGSLEGEAIVMQKDGPRSRTFSIEKLSQVLEALRRESRLERAGEVRVGFLAADDARWREVSDP